MSVKLNLFKETIMSDTANNQAAKDAQKNWSNAPSRQQLLNEGYGGGQADSYLATYNAAKK